MDKNTLQFLTLLGLAGTAWWIASKFATPKPGGANGEAGGVVGLVGDVLVGAKPTSVAEKVALPSLPPDPTYSGPPLLGAWIAPAGGSRIERLPYRTSYPVTVDVKNMTNAPISGRLEFDVREGSDVVHTHGDTVWTLAPQERKRFTVMVETRTVFTASQATAQAFFAGVRVAQGFYLVA